MNGQNYPLYKITLSYNDLIEYVVADKITDTGTMMTFSRKGEHVLSVRQGEVLRVDLMRTVAQYG